jgi:TolB-like protein/Flp pilus assembly protein TadD
MSLLGELRRRNVLRVGAAYIVTAWLIIQVAETVLPVYGFSDAAIRFVISALAAGLVPALVLAWVFEWTPDGLRRESSVDHSAPINLQAGKNLDRIIMVLLALALGYFAFDKFVLSESREARIAETAREAGRAAATVEAYGNRSIAVLPFVDMSAEQDQEYMSDGIAEELLNLLAKIPDLRVISRSSAFAFKNSDIDIPTIAAQLNAAFILEGSVRKAGDQIRITAQLIEAGTDTHRWSETYDRKLENIFAIQDEIAAHVVGELKVRLLGELPSARPVDEDAYTRILQARFFWNRRAPGDEERAQALYEQAVAIDPTASEAWSGLSVAYAVAANKNRMDRDEGFRLAREAVERAIELDPDSAAAHVRMAQAHGRDGNRDAARAEVETAYALEPTNPLVLAILASQKLHDRRIDETIRLYGEAEKVDPLGAIWPNNKTNYLLAIGDFDAAEASARRAYSLNSNLDSLRTHLSNIRILQGRFEDAYEHLQHLPATDLHQMSYAIVYQALGREAEAQAMLQQIIEENHPFRDFGLAQIYAQWGDNDRAFELLRRSRSIEDLAPWHIEYEKFFRVLHDDLRWQPMLDEFWATYQSSGEADSSARSR